MIDWITSVDFAILFWIQEHLRCGFLDAVFPVITQLGDKGIFWIVLALLLLIPRKTRTWGICMLVCLTVQFILGEGILKHCLPRQRPCVVQPIEQMLIALPHTVSFPSGHTSSSFAAAAALYSNDRRAGLAAYILAFLIAFSRLYCYVHFPTDILGGIVLGTCVSAILAPIVKQKRNKT